MAREIEVSAGTTEFRSGWTVIATPRELSYGPFDPTDIHEIFHAGVGIKRGKRVRSVTSVPNLSQGYLGATFFDEPDPVAAMAAHAMGCSGTSHDRHITHLMGHSESSAAGTARNIILPNIEQFYAAAAYLHQKRTASGDEIARVMEDALNIETNVILISPEGETRHFVTKVRKGRTIFIPPTLTEAPIKKPKLELVPKPENNPQDRPLLEVVHSKIHIPQNNEPISLSDYRRQKFVDNSLKQAA